MNAFNIIEINENNVIVGNEKSKFRLDRSKFELIDLPTTWLVRKIGDNITITCNPRLHSIKLEDIITNTKVTLSQSAYLGLLQKYWRKVKCI